MPRSRSTSLEQTRKKKKDSMTECRTTETTEEADTRRASGREYKRNIRAAETFDEAELRRAHNREHIQHVRDVETSLEADVSRTSNRRRMQNVRDVETSDKIDKRRDKDRHSKQTARCKETPDQSTERRTSMRLRMQKSVSEETPDQSNKRRSSMRQRTQTAVSEETPDQSNKRRSSMRQRTQTAVSEETPDQSNKRRAASKNRVQKRRTEDKNAELTIEDSAATFKSKIEEGPIYACSSCHRLMYRTSVVQLNTEKYTSTIATVKDLLKYSKDLKTNDKSWICKTCHTTLKRGQTPTQSWANDLTLDDVPSDLNDLRPLEVRLISQRIPFMKLVGLPKGGQKAIHGSAVNVPSKLQCITSLLPRLPNNAEVVPMKLKRKLVYKGHYMHEYIRPKKVMSALKWLKQNNPLYKDVDVCDDWECQWEDGDAELWEAMTNDNKQQMDTEEQLPRTSTSATASVAREMSPTLTSIAPIGNNAQGLQTLAKQHHLAIQHVPGDGDCFFHAISASLLTAGVQAVTGPRIRAQLIRYLETDAYSRNYSDFIPHPHTPGNQVAIVQDQDLQKQRLIGYIDGLKKGDWADNIAVQAVSDMLNINIRVLNTITPDWIHNIQPRTQRSDNTVTIGLIGQMHYVALRQCTQQEQIEETQARKEHIATEEDQEDEIAFDHTKQLRGIPYETLLQEEQTVDQDSTLSVAPAENQTPCAFLLDDNFEELANPTKYPYGNGGLSMKRHKGITPRKYFNQRLLDADGRFAKDIEYLLAAQYTVESKQVKDQLQISLRQTHGQKFQNRTVNAGLLKCSANLQAMIRTDTAFKFLKNVRGSPSYWKGVLLDLLAMVRQLGIPTWFLTLSAADMKWPEVIQSIARQYGTILTEDDIKAMPWEQKCSWLRRNPVTAARQFQHRLEAFFKEYIGAKSHPIGQLQDYVIRVEFQARGSPHAHTILWIKDAPKLDIDTDEEVIAFIDKYQTCSIPENEGEVKNLVETVQKHMHSTTCRKSLTSCRFKFPHEPSNATLIARPSTKTDPVRERRQNQQQQAVLERISKVMHDKDVPENISLPDLLVKAQVNAQQYQEALELTKFGKQIILRRTPSERWINQYNPAILSTWGANMDIQYIVDPYSCIMYITSYMMKSERAMSELLRKVAEESRGEDIKSTLRKVGSAFLNNREVSAQEAAYRLLSLPLKKSSRKVTFVNTAPKEKRVRLLKPKSVLNEMDNDDENIFCTSMLDRYSARPDELHGMCLAEFAASYNTGGKERNTDGDHIPDGNEDDEADDIDANEDKPSTTITLLNGLGYMKKRKRHCIIRFHKEKSEGDEKYRTLLMLYNPWRNEEEDLIGNHASFEDHYVSVKIVIDTNEAMFSQNAEDLQRAMDNFEEFGPPEHAWDAIAPGIEHEQAQQQAEGVVDEGGPHPDVDNNNIDLDAGTRPARTEIHSPFTAELEKSLMTTQEYRDMMRTLNPKQMEVIKMHRKWCKGTIYALKHNTPLPIYRIFLSGPGGVGKSHIIKLVHYETMKLLKPLSGHFEPDELPVLLTAFTGTAAFGIEGMTLHSAFSFSCGPGSKKEYQPLSSEKLNTLRSRLGKLKLLVIDETSMVGSDMLYHLHRRLQDITGKSHPDSRFGDVSILAVGDLYQLQPVGQSHVFGLPSDCYARLHGSLWEENFEMVELTESMRQKDDQQFAQMLMHVRTASCTDSDIAMLQSRETPETDPSYPKNALHVFKSNNEVDQHNTKHITSFTTTIFHVKAIDKKKDIQTGLIDVVISTKPSDTGGLREVVTVAVGARVMVTVNINVSDGLANGVCGTVVGINHTNNEVNTMFVKFDSQRVGKQAIADSQYKRTYPGAVPITRKEVQFYTGRGGRTSVQARRAQFPLTLAWGCTIHKVQGKTLDQIVVVMPGRGQFMPGQAYVAFSRVKTLDGLFLRGFNPTAIRVNPAIIKEMERLHQHQPETPEIPFVMTTTSTSKCLRVGLLNIRSYNQHLVDLKSDPIIKHVDAFCFTETFLREGQRLNENDLMRPNIKNFRTERPIASNLSKGGIMISAAVTLSPQAMGSNFVGIEYTAITVKKHGHKINVITMYRSPTRSSPTFLKKLRECVSSLDLDNLTIVLGDFNYDLLESPEHSIIQLMREYGFRQCVAAPTTDYGSLLDHVYVNKGVEVNIDILDTYYSDHDIVCSCIKL